MLWVCGGSLLQDCPYRHDNAPLVTTAVAANVPLCSGCGIDRLYKDCSMRRAPIDASNPRTTSLNLLGIKHGCIAQVSLNTITPMQAKAIVRIAQEGEREGQAGTSQTPKPQNNPPKKQAIKVGKGKDKVIVQSGFNKDMATMVTLETIGSLKMKSSQGHKGDEDLGKGKTIEPRPNAPSGLHEYPNTIQEKENLVKAKALIE